MATLMDLALPDRRELARKVARELFDNVLELNHAAHGQELAEHAYKLLGDADILHERNFYGKSFNDAQAKELDAFRAFWTKAHDFADLYDKCVAPVNAAAPGFSMPTHSLRRSYCVVHISNQLCKTDNPFASLLVATTIDDGEASEEEEEMASSDDDESGEGEEEDEDEAVTSEEEEDEAESSEEETSEEEEEEAAGGDDDQEKAQPDPAPRRKRPRSCTTDDLAPVSPPPECLSDA